MKRLLLAVVLGLVVLGPAWGQLGPKGAPNYGPGYRPGISPYLQLTKPGDAGVNYFTGTRPEQQRRQDARTFRAEIDDLSRRSTPDLDAEDVDIVGPKVTSGHATAFGNTTSFFNSSTPVIQRKLPGSPAGAGGAKRRR